MFDALLIEKSDAQQRVSVRQIEPDALPAGDVLVQIQHSTLNYKDALAITGSAPVVRQFPMVPGIDFAGQVLESADTRYQSGQQVILNGWGVGEKYWGGLAQYARVSGDWLVPLPDTFNTRQAMAIGTAGYTAMLCVMALERQGVHPGDGEVVVSGASGGVGSVAIALLGKLGYSVVALTGRVNEADYLRELGAGEIIDRADWSEPGKPLGRERWAGVVDTTGSHLLANLCATTRYGGVVSACGLAAGMDFPASVAPFILRGVTLCGIDSVMCPRETRLVAWRRLEQDLDPSLLDRLVSEIALPDAIDQAEQLLAGKVRGRVVVALS